MRQFVLPATLSLLLAIPAFGQTPGPVAIITGTVRDRNTQELLVGVTVQIATSSAPSATPIGTTTDADGWFKPKPPSLPRGRLAEKPRFWPPFGGRICSIFSS